MPQDPFERTQPIVTSLTDTDFYKLAMLAFIGSDQRLQAANTRFSFKNRTPDIMLAKRIREADINQELANVATLRFTETELRYLGGHFASEVTPSGEVNRRMFSQEFIDGLRSHQLSPIRVVREHNDAYTIDATGSWFSTTLWEIHVLQIMAQLYFESLIASLSRFERQCVWAEAQRNLLEKVRLLKRHPGITFVDFGTRRRASRAWQEYVNTVLLNELPNQYRGTSNILFSMQQHTVPMGTFAHELIMGMSGILHGTNDEIRDSQNALFDRWYEHFGQALSIALSDTYGTEFFLKSFGAERAALWKGTRQDSGDPFDYGEKLIAFYNSVGVDPKSKLIIFSDGLDVDTIIELYNRFRGRINVTFGWGTNLTNDFGRDFKPLSLVMKLMACNGHTTVKLSDDLGKAMGTTEDVERFKRIMGYTGTRYRQQRY